MKKIVTLLLMLAMVMSASAQLTMNQVLEKASKSISVKDGIKGKITMKMMGVGDTGDFSTDGERVYIADANEPEWLSEKTCYSVDTKAKTLTIIDGGEEFKLMLMPFAMAPMLLDAEKSKKAEISDLKMKTEKSQYVFTFGMKGLGMEFAVDKQTFHPKNLKMKKAFITVMSVSYANLTKLTDKSILTFDKSKYSSYKVIDERGKDKKKKK